jgi:glucan phosphoethanolaminetransferase (alkaline phosphatase superfamily)
MTLDNRHVSWTIFDALKCAGYQVDVITNQNKSGWADSPLQMIFSTADSISYMHEENFSDLAEDRDAQIYDGVLLPPFNQWLMKAQQDKKVPHFAVIHLFGSHDPFFARYPQGFGLEFLNDTSKNRLVNEYDASVLYSDMVLGKMLDELSKLNRPVYLIYLSDHGSVCESSGLRTPGSVENSAYEIPFLVWTNNSYQKLLPATVRQMKKHRSVPLQADRAHFGLLEVMGIDVPEKYEKSNFLSDEFEIVPLTVREGAYPYVSDAEIK